MISSINSGFICPSIWQPGWQSPSFPCKKRTASCTQAAAISFDWNLSTSLEKQQSFAKLLDILLNTESPVLDRTKELISG